MSVKVHLTCIICGAESGPYDVHEEFCGCGKSLCAAFCFATYHPDRPCSSRDYATKRSFLQFLEEHPEQRFWQAVRNWSGMSFILAVPADGGEAEDTFYWEEK